MKQPATMLWIMHAGDATAAHCTVRAARIDDAPAMAAVHVECWRETYRGLMHDSVLDDPTLLPRREAFWLKALGDPRFQDADVAVAHTPAGEIVGLALSNVPSGDDASTGAERQLHILYLLQAHHGYGVGTALMQAVLHPAAAAVLWVAEPNPRAQGFYRHYGFEMDGMERAENGMLERRMIRAAAARMRHEHPSAELPNAGTRHHDGHR